MPYQWTAHHINCNEDIDTIEELVKSSSSGRFKINELKFKNQDLRKIFNDKVKQKFVSTCGTNLTKEALDKFFDKDTNVWVTPYGNIKLSYSDTEL